MADPSMDLGGERNRRPDERMVEFRFRKEMESRERKENKKRGF